MEQYTKELINYYSFDKSKTDLELENKNINGLLDLKNFFNIKTLNCSNNLITKLKNIPNNLTKLKCRNNQISNLDTNLLNNLIELDCRANNISILETNFSK